MMCLSISVSHGIRPVYFFLHFRMLKIVHNAHMISFPALFSLLLFLKYFLILFCHHYRSFTTKISYISLDVCQDNLLSHSALFVVEMWRLILDNINEKYHRGKWGDKNVNNLFVIKKILSSINLCARDMVEIFFRVEFNKDETYRKRLTPNPLLHLHLPGPASERK